MQRTAIQTARGAVLAALAGGSACSLVSGLDDIELSPGVGQGAPCVEAGECATGHCADGVCCEGACDGPCVACDLARSPGVCSPALAASLDALCPPGELCDGEGACAAELPNGAPCEYSARCVSGHCVDGVCCQVDCDETCGFCNLPESPGVCGFMPLGDEDDGCQEPQFTCNGGGACKRGNGQPCSSGELCASGVCQQLPAGMLCAGP